MAARDKHNQQSSSRRQPTSDRTAERQYRRTEEGRTSDRRDDRRPVPLQAWRFDDNVVAGPSSCSRDRTIATGTAGHRDGSGNTGAATESLAARINTISPVSAQSGSSAQRTAEAQTGASTELIDATRSGNINSFSTRDRVTGVSSTWAIGPATRKTIRGPSENDDDGKQRRGGRRRFEDYEQCDDPERDYQFGRVIEVLLVPPPSDTTGALGLTSSAHFIEGTSVQKGRFVVIRGFTPGQAGFTALPIKTYNGYGVEGLVNKWHHCIIYTNRLPPHSNPPRPNPLEQPQRIQGTRNLLERPMQTQPILVEPRDLGTALDPMSRLDFFDVHEFEENVDRVKLFGKVHRDSRGVLRYQYEAVWARINTIANDRNPQEAAIPIPDLQRWYESLRARAVQLGLTQPRQLTIEELQRYAASHDLRTQLSASLQAAWIREARRMREEESSSDD